MRLVDLVPVPRHLLAATVERGRERIPVRVEQIGPNHLVVSRAPLARGDRARVTIACPLSPEGCEITAETVRTGADGTWLALVA